MEAGPTTRKAQRLLPAAVEESSRELSGSVERDAREREIEKEDEGLCVRACAR